tara:strand:- start:3110 stop:3814 length:705 start_codon:yes stop_codon:yes gene_type:complete
MKVIILAAGRGKRLKELTEDLPKLLLEINGKTILERNIETLAECGVKDIVIVIGYFAEKIREAVKNFDDVNIELVESKDYATTDNMYSSMLGGKKCVDEDVIIINGDTIISKEIFDLALSEECSNMPIKMDPSIKDGQRVVVEDNRITTIGKTLDVAQGIAINIVKFSKEDAKTYFNHVTEAVKEKRNEWWEQAINSLLSKIYVKALEIKEGFYLEIDDPEDLTIANEFLKNKE